MNRYSRAIGAALLLGTSTAEAANVLVVTPGAPFTDALQIAIDAAADGDILLIKAGTYETPVIVNKSLTLVGDGGQISIVASPAGPSPMQISLTAQHRVILRGLSIAGKTMGPFNSDAVNLSGGGGLWVDQCTLMGWPALSAFAGNVVVTNSTLRGGGGYAYSIGAGVGFAGADSGLYAGNSAKVYAYATTIVGGDGFDAYAPLTIPSTPGAAAVRAHGGVFFLSGGSLTGGTGGDSAMRQFFCIAGSSGGSALHLQSGSPLVYITDVPMAAGPSGAVVGTCTAPADAPVILIDSGSILEIPVPTGDLTLTSTVREGQNATLTVSHVPSSAVVLFVSAGVGTIPATVYGGALHLGTPIVVVPLGKIGVSGSLALSAPIPNLPPSIMGLDAFMQAGLCPPAAPCSVSPPASLTILDATL